MISFCGRSLQRLYSDAVRQCPIQARRCLRRAGVGLGLECGWQAALGEKLDSRIAVGSAQIWD